MCKKDPLINKKNKQTSKQTRIFTFKSSSRVCTFNNQYFLGLIYQQGDTGLGNRVFNDFLTERQVRLILGPSRSNVAESAGATAMYYNIVQVNINSSRQTIIP